MSRRRYPVTTVQSADIGADHHRDTLLAETVVPLALLDPQPVLASTAASVPSLAEAEHALALQRRHVEIAEKRVEELRKQAGAGQRRVLPDDITARRAISPTELSIQLGLSRSSVLRACRDGRVRCTRFGRRFIIPFDEAGRILATGTLPAA
jgi:hypothetical protein